MRTTALSAQTPVFDADLISAAYNEGEDSQPLNGTATVTDGGTITYRWQVSSNGQNWSDIQDAVGALYYPPTDKPSYLIRSILFYRVVAENFVDGLFPSEDLYPGEDLYPSDGVTADAVSNTAQITIYPKLQKRSENMIKFTDKRLFVKGTGNAILTDPVTGKIVYQSDQFTTGSISTSVTLGEIRAGLGNPIVAMLPTDANITVEFTAADFSLSEKAAQVGAEVRYGAPVPVAQTVTAASASLTIDVSGGAPVPALGFDTAYCQVQTVGAASHLLADGTAYEIDQTGAISGFTASIGTTYKVWYYVNKATAQKATIGTLMDPKVLHFSVALPVYSSISGTANSGTRVGWLYVTVPALKLQANANISGDQTNADTTVITGQGISISDSVVSASTDLCGEVGNDLAYYVYSPCDDSDVVQGLVVVGGVVSLAKSSSKQIPVYFVMPDNSLVKPTNYSDGFTYTPSGLPSGTTVSNSGVITAGTTAGSSGEVVVSYAGDSATYSVPVNVEVTN